MKHRLLIFVLVTALLIMTVTGCAQNNEEPVTPTPTPEQTTPETALDDPKTPSEPETVSEPDEPSTTDYLLVYGELLDFYYYLLTVDLDQYDFDAIPGTMGLLEATQAMDTDEALDSVGYILLDISGDKIPEMLIGTVTNKDTFSPYSFFIYAGYTIVAEKPYLTFEGVSRSNYTYLGGGDLLYRGSSGAMNSIFGTYSISADGASLSVNDCYFTHEKGEGGQEIGYFHNTSGHANPAVSEELSITDEEFWQKLSDLEEKIQPLDLIPFSEYRQTDHATDGMRVPAVHAHWAEDILAQYGDYDEFSIDETEPQSRVALTTDRTVHELNVLMLALESVDDDGNIHFSTEELLEDYSLLPDTPLVLVMTFYGSIPQYGISYEDESGTTRYFAFTVSGEDGSILLDEFFLD
jgi:hypothetical protein